MVSKQKTAYLYILAKSIYENDGNIIECCSPFVFNCLSDSYCKIHTIQQDIKKTYSFELPQNTLLSLLNILKQKAYVAKSQKQGFIITKKGKEYLDKVEKEEHVRRRLNALYDDVIKYYKERNSEITIDEITELVHDFSIRNVGSLLCFFSGKCNILENKNIEIPITIKLTEKEKLLVKYIQHAFDKKPANYSTLRDIVLGAIFTIISCVDDDIEISSKYSGTVAYLDSNFVFNILQLHSKEFNKPALELLELLKKYNFELRLFDFTLAEVTRVIKAYVYERSKYPNGVRVNSIHSSLNQKGWSKQTAIEFISNIEEKLENLGIGIERTGIKSETYEPKDFNISSQLEKYKPLQPKLSKNHDMAAIEYIQQLRGGEVRKLQESKVFFLTADGKLCNANYFEMGHKVYGTICEVVLDRLLTNILWMLDPSFNISLESLIAVCARDLFVKQRVWEQFHEVLCEIVRNDTIPIKDLSTLFYHNHIEDALIDLDESDVEIITDDYVASKIKESRKFIDAELKRELSEKAEELEQCLRNKEQYDYQSIHKKAEVKAEKYAKSRAKLWSSALTVVLILGVIRLYFILKSTGDDNALAILLSLILGSGILGAFKTMNNYLFTIIKKQMINKNKQFLTEVGVEFDDTAKSLKDNNPIG